jgi:hypothetical protein
MTTTNVNAAAARVTASNLDQMGICSIASVATAMRVMSADMTASPRVTALSHSIVTRRAFADLMAVG